MVSNGKLKRTWVPIATTGIIALSVLGAAQFSWISWGPRQPDIPRHENPATQGQPYQAGGERCSPEWLDRLAKSPDASVERERCAEAQQTYEASKEALRQGADSVNAAEQALLVSHYQSKIGFWQTFATMGALIAAVAAALYAKHAAYDTRRAANIAERALTSLERPYLVFEIVKSDVVVLGKTTTFGPVTYRYRNFGRTPAVLTRDHFELTYYHGLPDPIDPAESGGRAFPFGLVIGVDGESKDYETGNALPIISAVRRHVSGAKSGEDLILYGYIGYRDLAGAEYRTGFCFRHGGNETGFDIIGPRLKAGEPDLYNYDRKVSSVGLT